MQIDDFLAQAGGLSSIARELGISEAQARAGAAALLPAILGGFAKQQPPAGTDGLGSLFGQLGGASLLDDVLSTSPTDVGRGNHVLGNLFGSKDVSRTVAQHAAAQSGLEPSLLRKMLPLLAMLAVGYMARRHGQARNAPKADAGSTTTSAPTSTGNGNGSATNGGGFGGLGDLLGGLSSIFGGGKGNPLDDILRKAGMGAR
jgi:hypothetical protein